jgi:hypothetical protein
MDCKTARLLLPFAGPTPGELDPAEADALEAHLDSCPECSAGARAERRLDEHLGPAMRAVEVPDRLKALILAGLAEQRRDERRRRLGRKLRIAVPVAAALLMAVYLWAFGSPFKGGVNLVEVCDQVNKQTIVSLEPDAVEAAFRRMGVETKVPRQFASREINYAYLTPPYGLTELPGQQGQVVPQLIFVRGDQRERVIVYILSARQFKLSSLANPPPSDPGYTYKLDVDYNPNAKYAYLVFYTGKNYDWLLT